MTPTPPYFLAQMEEQKKWDDGFKAGISEVLTALKESVDHDDLASPTANWVTEFSQKLTNKYL